MSGDTGERFLLERQPQRSPAAEKLREYLDELASRAAGDIRVTMSLSGAAWRAFQAEKKRPGQCSPTETITVGKGWVLVVKKMGEELTP